MKNSPLSLTSKVLLFLAAALFVGSLFVPLWRIELDAPQYPEGLLLQLHANKIGGNVDIINGLNHYIGMATLHTENFIEFSVLPYVFSAFALIAIGLIFLNSKKSVKFFFITLIVFVAFSGIDFYRWNYEYGHNLDPNAAIIVPGMAYQPPVLGYKQLLNFGAFSIPDIGGYMLAAAIMLVGAVVVMEYNLIQKFKNRKK
ncbi:MAG: hypothetical protein ACOH1O_02575 [Flavobacterium sp.]